MALDQNVLGQLLFNNRIVFNNKTKDQLIAQYGSLDAALLEACKADAKAIIDHFKADGVLRVPGLGLVSPTGNVTGTSTTGKIE